MAQTQTPETYDTLTDKAELWEHAALNLAAEGDALGARDARVTASLLRTAALLRLPQVEVVA